MRALVFIRSIEAGVTTEDLTERHLPADNIVKGNIWYGMVPDLSRYRALVRLGRIHRLKAPKGEETWDGTQLDSSPIIVGNSINSFCSNWVNLDSPILRSNSPSFNR